MAAAVGTGAGDASFGGGTSLLGVFAASCLFRGFLLCFPSPSLSLLLESPFMAMDAIRELVLFFLEVLSLLTLEEGGSGVGSRRLSASAELRLSEDLVVCALGVGNLDGVVDLQRLAFLLAEQHS